MITVCGVTTWVGWGGVMTWVEWGEHLGGVGWEHGWGGDDADQNAARQKQAVCGWAVVSKPSAGQLL